mmetsp:Transcript_19055/g.34306  ORF Transcript_19055/g.34306 Transcript_19055/m.34306 type:complete len:455 (+) Transcript_19055:151-1515(+)|eukprot:CAMPEP_0196135918 /NCGR_PEP_ID=MMETSP0910-20130528/4401_1 /TAXON_ID=49265 /ORGANISM="Thalassiosira rotula, Strain GSO102" /LENGTH=454 /DNA_ID=CAMNT_0041396123 /DNA_START=133 /DNA_END=1497 /DNA_ORIENTATION=+
MSSSNSYMSTLLERAREYQQSLTGNNDNNNSGTDGNGSSGRNRSRSRRSNSDSSNRRRRSGSRNSRNGRRSSSGVRTGRSRTTTTATTRQGDSSSSDEEDGRSYNLHTDTADESNARKISKSSVMYVRPKKGEATSDYQLEDDDSDSVEENNQIGSDPSSAHYKQNMAPFSTAFCFVQCFILPLMMWQCGIAPMNINPMIGPYPDALNYWGAKNAVLIIEDGEFWRLFTPIFLHAGLIHLMGNVMVQIDAGNRWEKEWGSLIWMIIYIGSAFGSSVFSTCFMPDNISVGSSGAVMGLFGAKFAEILLLCLEKSTNVKELAGERSRKEQACLVIGGIVVVAAMSFIPYVDWAAHLGGMIAGLVLGAVCFSFKIRSWFFMVIWFVVGVGSTMALYSAGMAYMYNDVETKDELRDVCGYYQQYFDDYECKCMLDEAIQFGSWQFGGGNNNNNGGSGD